MVHCDLVEFPIESYYRHKYCLTIIDDYSGYSTICLLRAKLDTARAFSVWVTWAENQWSASLLQVHSDRGGEFMATIFRSFLTDKGVQHQLSVWIIHNKTVVPNDSIKPYWKKKKRCITQHVYQRTYGTLPLTLQFMSTTELRCAVFNGKPQLNLYSRRNQISLIFESLVV